jgi:tRNA/rRNA methyltransferase
MTQNTDRLLADGPAIILVEPQLGENIGTAARAMANFGLGDLRIVNPRDGWPNESARRAASRADHVFDRIRVFDTLSEAVADLGFLIATTARSREIVKTVRGPASAAAILRGHAAAGTGTGILFGRERVGLFNEEISLCDEIVTLPVDPRFASLNIAQAVLILGYEWRRSGLPEEEGGLPFQTPNPSRPATKDELLGLFEHLERALDAVTFFRPAEKKPVVVQTLRAMLTKASFTEQDIRTMRGVIAALENRPTRPRRRSDGSLTTSRETDEEGTP